jgi:hypothetical protein
MSDSRKKHLGTKRIENPPEKDYSTYPSRVLLGENPLPEGVTSLVLGPDEVAAVAALGRLLAERDLGEELIDAAGNFDLAAALRTLERLGGGAG